VCARPLRRALRLMTVSKNERPEDFLRSFSAAAQAGRL
jgi:hypothetical protein